MYKAEKTASGKNKFNAHVANQFTVKNYSFKKSKETDIWPLDYKQDNIDKKTFPESWSVSPVNDLFFGKKAS